MSKSLERAWKQRVKLCSKGNKLWTEGTKAYKALV